MGPGRRHTGTEGTWPPATCPSRSPALALQAKSSLLCMKSFVRTQLCPFRTYCPQLLTHWNSGAEQLKWTSVWPSRQHGRSDPAHRPAEPRLAAFEITNMKTRPPHPRPPQGRPQLAWLPKAQVQTLQRDRRLDRGRPRRSGRQLMARRGRDGFLGSPAPGSSVAQQALFVQDIQTVFSFWDAATAPVGFRNLGMT